jgi:N-dimethylarginine dimethylaminohydrolase
MGREAVARIEAAFLVDGFKLGQFVAMRLDKRLFVGGNVLLDRDGLVAGRGAVTSQSGAQLVQVKVETARDQRQIVIHVAALFPDEKAGDGGVVVDDETAFAVEQLAARGQDGLLADAVLFRQLAKVLRAEHLEPPELGSEDEQHGKNSILHHRQLEGGELFVAFAVNGNHASTPLDTAAIVSSLLPNLYSLLLIIP